MKYLKIETPGVQQHPEGFKTSLNARDDASLDSPNQQVKLVPQDCPKFDACRAPICPLDPEMLDRTYLSGESVCPLPSTSCQNRYLWSKTCLNTEDIRRQGSFGLSQVGSPVFQPKKRLRKGCQISSKNNNRDEGRWVAVRERAVEASFARAIDGGGHLHVLVKESGNNC